MAYIDDKGSLLKIRYFENNTKGTDPGRWEKTPEGRVLANLRLREIDKRIAYADPVAKGADLTTDDVGGRWLLDKSRESNRKAYAKAARRRWDLVCQKNGWLKMSHITAASVKKWRDGGWSVGAARIVRSILYWSQGAPCEQIIPQAVFSTIDIPVGRSHETLMEDWEAKLIQRRADKESEMAGAMVYVYQAYAWRPITMSRLKVGDVNVKTKLVRTIVKDPREPLGVRDHIVAMDPEMAQRFGKLVVGRAPSEPLFIHPLTGQAFTEEQGHHRNACVWLNRHLGAKYENKRFAMSKMRQAGLDNTEVMSITGHKSEEAVNRYMRSNLDGQRAALAKLRGKGKPPASGQTTEKQAGPELVREGGNRPIPADTNIEKSSNILQFPIRTGT